VSEIGIQHARSQCRGRVSVSFPWCFGPLEVLYHGSVLVLAEKGFISRAVFFVYPHVFIAGPNKDDNLLEYLCRRNAKFDSMEYICKHLFGKDADI
jgi:hypothetical protein